MLSYIIHISRGMDEAQASSSDNSRRENQDLKREGGGRGGELG